MYQSKIRIRKQDKQSLLKAVTQFIVSKPSLRCKKLKRTVRLTRFIEANKRRDSFRRRLESFFVAIDIIKHSKEIRKTIIDGYKCYSMHGFDANKTAIEIHIREDVHNGDRVLYMISCYPKKPPPSSSEGQSF